jgi:hypothetical protein
MSIPSRRFLIRKLWCNILFWGYNPVNQINPKNQGSDNGASFKDLGKKLFAFSKMEMKSRELLKNI